MPTLKHKIILALLLLVFHGVSIAQSSQVLPASKADNIDAEVAAWMAKYKAPALSVAIVKDNKMMWSKGYGLADVEKRLAARSDTVYRLASITKSITAIAVMQLVERGKIDLDAPIQKYCSAYPKKQWEITPRQLLVHFAGVRHNKDAETVSTKHYSGITESINAFKDDPLLFEPETKYSYSTPGYVLLGCAIESASGVSYPDYLKENIFKPAGMTQTGLDDSLAIIPNRAAGYRTALFGKIQNAPAHDTSIKIPAGGLVSTVEDMARFAIAVNSSQLVKAETLEKMWTKPKTRDGKESNYAFGFLVGEKEGQKRVFNDGSQAGTRTFLFVLPKENFAVILMTNLEKAWCEELVPKIIDTVLKDK
jgi:CubicO group peptidase (beta-lactamase class C family)